MNNRKEILEKMDLDEEEYAQIKIVTNGIYLGFILFVVPSIMIFIDYLLHLHILATLIAVGVAYSLFSPMFLEIISDTISGGKYTLKDTFDNPEIVWDLITEAFLGRDCEDTPNKKKSPLRTAKRITIIFWGVIYILISLVLAILILAGLIYTIGGLLLISWEILKYLGWSGVAFIIGGISVILLIPIIAFIIALILVPISDKLDSIIFKSIAKKLKKNK